MSSKQPFKIMDIKAKGTICFSIDDQPEEVLKLEKGFFWYRGKKINDINNAYERFCKFLSLAESKKGED